MSSQLHPARFFDTCSEQIQDGLSALRLFIDFLQSQRLEAKSQGNSKAASFSYFQRKTRGRLVSKILPHLGFLESYLQQQSFLYLISSCALVPLSSFAMVYIHFICMSSTKICRTHDPAAVRNGIRDGRNKARIQHRLGYSIHI